MVHELTFRDKLRLFIRTMVVGEVSVHQCQHGFFHEWRHHHFLVSGVYDSGEVSRDGHMCKKCATIIYDQSDEEFINNLPEWLLIRANHVPEKYWEYLPAELWRRRVAYQNELTMDAWNRLVEHQQKLWEKGPELIPE